MNTHTETPSVDPLWETLRRHLEARRRPVEDEIRRYPAPIAGCDAHFNYLLEQRTALSRELVRLETECRAAGTGSASRRAAEAFLRSSACIGAEDAAQLEAELKSLA